MTKSKNPPPLLDCLDDLPGSFDYAWHMLVNGARNRRSPFHTPTVATIDQSGMPQIRTVVLRDANAKEAWLRFNTDKRSQKLEEIARHHEGAMHFYDADEKIQLRVACQFRRATEEECDAIWEKTPSMSRECYQVIQAPGTIISDPLDISFDRDDDREGRVNFQPIFAQVHSIEWLYLAASGHRRALFKMNNVDAQQYSVDMQWLVP